MLGGGEDRLRFDVDRLSGEGALDFGMSHGSLIEVAQQYVFQKKPESQRAENEEIAEAIADRLSGSEWVFL